MTIDLSTNVPLPERVDSIRDGKILSNRSCTDCCMILVFGIFVIGWIIVGSVAISKGKPSRLLLPENFRGELCGDSKGLENLEYMFLPKPSRLSYGLCVERCPGIFDYVCNNDKEAPLANLSAPPIMNTYYAHTSVEYFKGPQYVSRCAIPGFCNTTETLMAERFLGLLKKVKEYKCFLAFYSSGATLHRCIPLQDSSNDNATIAELAGETSAALSSLAGSVGVAQFFQRGFGETKDSWIVILICCLTACVISMIWVFLLRWILAPIVYLCILLIFALLVAIGYFAYKMANDLEDVTLPGDTATKDQVKVWRTVQFVFWIAAGMYFIAMVWMLKRIRIAICIMKEGSKAFLSNPGLVIIPPIVLVLLLGMLAFFVVLTVYIQSIGEINKGDFRIAANNAFGGDLVNATLAGVEKAANGTGSLLDKYNVTNSSSDGSVNTTEWKTSQIVKALHAYNFFGFLWVCNLCIMFGFFVMAMATCVWYYSATAVEMDNWENGDSAMRESGEARLKSSPVGTTLRSFCAALRYHLGTILWGSLLIAIIQFIRALFLYIQEEFLDQWKDSVTVKVVISCINCCLWYIETVIKIISKNAFIITCIRNTSFCSSAEQALELLVSNAARVSALYMMSTVACFVLKLFIVASNCVVAYFLIRNKSLTNDQKIESGLFPLIGIFIITFVIASLFINVYESCTDTVMMCFLVDERYLEGSFMPKPLALLVDQFEKVEQSRKEYENGIATATSGSAGKEPSPAPPPKKKED